MKKKIDPEKWYSLKDLSEGGMIPFLGARIARYRHFMLNRNGIELLKPVIMGSGKAKRYSFKGQNIIDFLKKAESGKFTK